MFAFSALKLLLGGFLKKAGEFIAANWRWLLPLIAALLLFWYVKHLQGARDDAIQALADYRQEVATAVQVRKLENERKEAEAARALNAIAAGHQSEIEALRRRYAQIHQADKTAAAGTIDQWRERVRLEVARNTAAGLPSIPEPAEGSADVRRDSDAATARSSCETVELACAVTTADYNALWEAWAKSCEIYGCR